MVLKVGMVAFGMVGQVFHGPLIDSHSDFVLTHVVERNSEKSREKYPSVTVLRTLNDLLKTDVDVVIIGTPSSQHFEHAHAALLAGKHVIVEKPFTVTAQEADDLITLAKTQKRVLTVFQNRRWDSDFLTVQRVIGGGLLGKLSHIEIHYDRYRPNFKQNWREEALPGSGILYDLGSHLIDQVLVLMGNRLPDAVFADIRHQREGAQVDDFFDVDLRYNNHPELKITLRAGMLVRTGGPRYILHGTNGSFVKYGLDVQEDSLKAGLTPKNNPEWGTEPNNIWGQLETEVNGLKMKAVVQSEQGRYLDFYSNVSAAIREEAELAVEPTHARDVIRVIEAALRSSREKAVVNL
eukprot:c8238_g1_i1.p1 GENE.c8238_g1_i1~~c8238_g1_i1.p1  ORF type:complete len:351 (+),score=101.71 c8238_g1_i1:38-1090(+)